MSKTVAERAECAIAHPYEREAVALLYQAGWSLGELSMTFQVSEASIRRLLVAEGVADDD